jgi:type IV pilus assembly protein PilA
MTLQCSRESAESAASDAHDGFAARMARSSLRSSFAVPHDLDDLPRLPHLLGPRRERSHTTATQAGFTLVELMIVVVIVGVLAVIAVVGFRKLVGQAHTTEATQMVQAIRVAQESFHAETGSYADISASLCVSGVTCPDFYPQASLGVTTVGDFKAPWGVHCTTCTFAATWDQLPVHTQGAVLYGYSTIAGTASTAHSLASTNGVTVPSPLLVGSGSSQISVSSSFPNGVPSDWYLISAVGDEDSDAQPCVVLGSSFTADLAVAAEGN